LDQFVRILTNSMSPEVNNHVKVSSGSEVCKTWTDDLYEANSKPDQLIYIPFC
jgi:hypothetical protein